MSKLNDLTHRGEDVGFLYSERHSQNWGRYSNRRYALVLLMESGVSLLYGGVYRRIPKNSVLAVPAGAFPQLVFSTPESHKRCIIDFGKNTGFDRIYTIVMKQFKIFSQVDPGVITIFEEIIKVVKSDLSDNEKTAFIRSSLTVLLTLLDIHYADYDIAGVHHYSPLVERAMKYVDNHLTEAITIEDMAEQFYVSSSSLAHKFREETGIPVYRYITKKRLAMANALISDGESRKSAAISSGFSDYACFYRLNKKYGKDTKK